MTSKAINSWVNSTFSVWANRNITKAVYDLRNNHLPYTKLSTFSTQMECELALSEIKVMNIKWTSKINLKKWCWHQKIRRAYPKDINFSINTPWVVYHDRMARVFPKRRGNHLMKCQSYHLCYLNSLCVAIIPRISLSSDIKEQGITCTFCQTFFHHPKLNCVKAVVLYHTLWLIPQVLS